jgi:hypothetical protein
MPLYQEVVRGLELANMIRSCHGGMHTNHAA